ncbi:hypothetical protein [Saccharothrix xinjiangensis]|uniref:Uncharacterized protein n=1 Tax=Saccharothrix xinjiangensis TaxID=204798 RepID=A0ABV9Y5I6_9PSEU
MGRSALWGLLIGWALMVVLLTAGITMSDADGVSTGEVMGTFIGSMIVGAPLGALPGTLIGVLVGAARRRPRPVPPPPFPAHLPPPPPPPNDRWAAMVSRCELSVRRVAAAVATVPPSPARDWLERIAAQFGGELGDVRRIAELGRALGADQQHPVAHRMSAAVRDFTAFEDEVGRVALQMFNQPSLERARVHLEVLEQQLPHLGND